MDVTFNTEVKTFSLKVSDRTQTIVTPDTLFEVVKGDFNPIQEEIYVLILDNKAQVIDKILVAKGCINNVQITPAEIFRLVFLTNGNRFILAHNHPSGDVTPSEEDIQFTNKVIKGANACGLDLIDHIVYTESNYLSFKQKALIA